MPFRRDCLWSKLVERFFGLELQTTFRNAQPWLVVFAFSPSPSLSSWLTPGFPPPLRLPRAVSKPLEGIYHTGRLGTSKLLRVPVLSALPEFAGVGWVTQPSASSSEAGPNATLRNNGSDL